MMTRETRQYLTQVAGEAWGQIGRIITTQMLATPSPGPCKAIVPAPRVIREGRVPRHLLRVGAAIRMRGGAFEPIR
eukprot:10980787-Alexandrium_andersonii.AAC.1